MSRAKLSSSKTGQPLHYSIGALIEQDNSYLLIERVRIPYGFAGPAGHIDEGETPEEALFREVREETGLLVRESELLFEEELAWNTCSQGVNTHHWYLYQCEVQGRLDRSLHETRSIAWYRAEEIKKLKLEPAWHYWLQKLKII